MMLRSHSFAVLALLCLLSLGACTASRPPAYQGSSADGLIPGEEVTVARGENVYTIAKKNNVRMRDIIALNNLQPPFTLKAGQHLVLPARGGINVGGDAPDIAPAPSSAPSMAIEKQAIISSSSAVTSVPLEEPLAQKSTVQPAQPQAVLPSKVPFATPTPEPEPAAPLAAPTSIAPAPPAAAQAQTTASSSSAAPAAAGSLIWPLQGPILSAYGSKGQGMNNDGINISAPKGAPVVAAAGGTVAYAGDEMKGFGNLVLIRHEGNLITAYAHLDRIIVAKDNIVAAGDMIGTVGTTGGVASPQLHFEVRDDGRARDPALYIKK